MSPRYRRRIAEAAALGLFLLLAFRTAEAKQAAFQSLRLCAGVLLPALFPFSVASNLFLGTGAYQPFSRLLRRPLAILGFPDRAAGPLLTGLLGGYPIGIQSLTAAYQSGMLSKEEAVRVSMLCNQAGPGFLLGAVGLSLYGSKKVGLLLWLVQLLSLLAAALLFSGTAHGMPAVRSRRSAETLPVKSLLVSLPEAIRRSCLGMLTVCGCVVFFGTLCGLLQPLLDHLPEPLPAVLAGALELSGGVLCLPVSPLPLSFVLCAGLLSWGGCSVHVQSATALREAGLPLRPYLLGKLAQTGFSLVFSLIFSLFL